jgi:hypothetical protein
MHVLLDCKASIASSFLFHALLVGFQTISQSGTNPHESPTAGTLRNIYLIQFFSHATFHLLDKNWITGSLLCCTFKKLSKI